MKEYGTENDTSFDTDYRSNIICPYCGEVHNDSWEFFSDGTEEIIKTECSYCDKPIEVYREIQVFYSTSKDQ
jgi:uncharacterized Zn-finger protein